MSSTNGISHANGNGVHVHKPKKQIFLNAFDMCTVAHLSPGQWRNPKDKTADKRKLSYWIDLARLLEKGNFNALFLADSLGAHDTYGGNFEEAARRGAQWPITDPTIPITAMAAATKNLAFGVTVSTSFESPFVLAKRFSTLDHLTDGRIGWNIVTSWKASAFKAIGMAAPTEHDQRYAIADEYLRVLYKLWEGSWADDAVMRDAETDTYVDPSKLRKINHHGKYFNLETPHIVDPSPQRTPFLFQAGISTAGAQFAAQHAEGVFVSGQTTAQLRPKVDLIRKNAKEQGRDPRSIKIFGTFMPIIGQTEEEAQAKLAVAKKYTSTIGGLVLASSWTGIDLSTLPLDEEIPEDLVSEDKHRRTLSEYTKPTAEIPKWTPRLVGEKIGLSAIGPIAVGTPEQVADEMERWIEEADLDGFNVGYITTPGTFEDVIDLLIPELRRRGVYPEKIDEGLTAREKIYGKGQSKLRDDHTGSKYKYHVYKEDPPYVAEPSKRQRVD